MGSSIIETTLSPEQRASCEARLVDGKWAIVSACEEEFINGRWVVTKAWQGRVGEPSRQLSPSAPNGLPTWGQIVVNEVASLALCYAKSVGDDRGHTILVPLSLFTHEPQERISVSGMATRVTVPGELVYINFDPHDDMARAAQIRIAFHRVPLPPIEGVEEEYAWCDTPKGVVILRRKLRQVLVDEHPHRSLVGVVTPE